MVLLLFVLFSWGKLSFCIQIVVALHFWCIYLCPVPRRSTRLFPASRFRRSPLGILSSFSFSSPFLCRQPRPFNSPVRSDSGGLCRAVVCCDCLHRATFSRLSGRSFNFLALDSCVLLTNSCLCLVGKLLFQAPFCLQRFEMRSFPSSCWPSLLDWKLVPKKLPWFSLRYLRQTIESFQFAYHCKVGLFKEASNERY